MCGIVGYTGLHDAKEILLKGLRSLNIVDMIQRASLLKMMKALRFLKKKDVLLIYVRKWTRIH